VASSRLGSRRRPISPGMTRSRFRRSGRIAVAPPLEPKRAREADLRQAPRCARRSPSPRWETSRGWSSSSAPRSPSSPPALAASNGGDELVDETLMLLERISATRWGRAPSSAELPVRLRCRRLDPRFRVTRCSRSSRAPLRRLVQSSRTSLPAACKLARSRHALHERGPARLSLVQLAATTALRATVIGPGLLCATIQTANR
jgi:hypothetical protein